MGYTTPPAVTTGDLATASDYNTYVKDNIIALRTGAIAAANQANGHFVIATGSAQLSAQKNSYVRLFQEVFG